MSVERDSCELESRGCFGKFVFEKFRPSPRHRIRFQLVARHWFLSSPGGYARRVGNSGSTMDSEFNAVIVGAGFAGMYMLHRVRQLGLRARVFEAGSDVGGTWYWNRYPGARCDVESVEYSYQFDEDLQQEWEWTERYAAQPEILRYAGHVADRFLLRADIHFNTRVVGATFDEGANHWEVRTDASTGPIVTAQFLIMATGCLSSTNTPPFEGKDSFAGRSFHTGQWPHEPVNFAGRRVGVIGTGSSAIQSIPVIAAQAERLLVFQRTPTYTVPAHNGAIDPAEVSAVKANYADFRAANRRMPGAFGSRTPPRREQSVFDATPEERDEMFRTRWNYGGFGLLGAFGDLVLDQNANTVAAQFVRDRIAELVDDPNTAKLLSPTHTIGCKRLVIDTDYFATFNRPNVSLVDISSNAIERITPKGVVTGGSEYEVDDLVFATGFDAMTGTLLKIDIRGRDDATLREAWSAGPRTYLGLGVVGFPNLFTVSGPGSPSVLTNMIISIEQHVDWIASCVSHMRAEGFVTIDVTPEAQDAWVDNVNAIADRTLYPSCNSWYLGANVPGKTRVFMPYIGFPAYADTCESVAANNYEGFVLSR